MLLRLRSQGSSEPPDDRQCRRVSHTWVQGHGAWCATADASTVVLLRQVELQHSFDIPVLNWKPHFISLCSHQANPQFTLKCT